MTEKSWYFRDKVPLRKWSEPDTTWSEDEIIANGERCYELGVQDSMLRATQYERILTDLIAELRDIQSATYEQRSSVELVARREETLDALDRAGARLREVGDE